MSAGAKARTWEAIYLLPHAASPSATPDKKAKGYFRHKDVVTAATQAEVVRDIVARRATVVDVREVKPAHPLLGGRIKKDFKQQFLTSLIFSVEGGRSPGQALEQAIESETGPRRQRLNMGLNALRQGRSFLDALRAIDMYDTTTMAIIEAGEETGTLPQSLKTAETHLQRGNEAIKTIVAALTWTTIDLGFAIMSVVSTRFGLIPFLRDQNKGAKNPEVLERALDMATLANDVMILVSVLLLVAILAGAWGYFGRNEAFRARVDAILLKTPVVRDLIAHTAVAGTCGVMASLLRGGVNFIPATQIAERGTRTLTVIKYWLTARTRVETGESPAAATAMEPFTDNERMILRSHTDSTQLSQAYEKINKQRDELAKAAARRFAKVAFFSTLAYSFMSVLLVLIVVYLQNESNMNLSFSGQ